MNVEENICENNISEENIYEENVCLEPEEIEAKPKVRRTVNHVFLWIILYNLLVMVISGIVTAAGGTFGLESLIATLAGSALVYLLTLKRWPISLSSGRKMTGGSFLALFSLLCLTQMITTGIMAAVDASGASGTSIDLGTMTVPMIIYVGLTGPVCEELIYRGFTAGNLKRHGKIFAIVLSALAFGLMHMNLTQFVAGFLSGLVLGYIFVEYSIGWTILVHVINNLVLSTLPGIAFSGTAQEYAYGTVNVIVILLAVYGVYVLIKNRGEIKAYLRDPSNRADAGCAKHTLTSVWFWIFVIFYGAAIVFLMANPEIMEAAESMAAAMAAG